MDIECQKRSEKNYKKFLIIKRRDLKMSALEFMSVSKKKKTYEEET